METLTAEQGENPLPSLQSPLSLCLCCHHRGTSQAGMWLHSSPAPQTPIWSPAGCAATAGGHCNDPSPFVINPQPYPWHSIPRATAASSSASAPSHPSGPRQPPWGARVGRGVLPGPSTFLKRSRGCRQQRRCCVPEPQPEQELGAKGSLLACWSKWQVIKRNCDRRENVPESTRTSPG